MTSGPRTYKTVGGNVVVIPRDRAAAAGALGEGLHVMSRRISRPEPVDSRDNQEPRAVRRVSDAWPNLAVPMVQDIVAMVIDTIITQPCEKCDLPAVERRWTATNREGVRFGVTTFLCEQDHKGEDCTNEWIVDLTSIEEQPLHASDDQ